MDANGKGGIKLSLFSDDMISNSVGTHKTVWQSFRI